MKTSIITCLLALTLTACAIEPAAEQSTPTAEVPPARIYIKSMTQPAPDMVEVQFSRTSTFLFGSAPLELSINDVVLAQIFSGEHFSIWLKPGTSYTFGVKPVHTLNSPSYPQTSAITVALNAAGVHKIRISANMQGPTLQQEE